MGHTAYSSVTSSARSAVYEGMSIGETFTQRSINNAMSPHGISVRESRDSEAHPTSLAIIIALDVTGSMGSVPHFLVKKGLTSIMDTIIKSGIPHPQILFLGIGDHECDSSPLQVGQFESGDELLDKWLTDIYLEGGGGGNAGESYMLAWYLAAKHTDIDCFNKRNQKGFLFTIGDEPVLEKIPAKKLRGIMGEGQYEDMASSKLYDMARKAYNVYHVHIRETCSGQRQHVMDGWKQLLSNNLLIAKHKQDVAELIAGSIITNTIVAPAAKQDEMIL